MNISVLSHIYKYALYYLSLFPLPTSTLVTTAHKFKPIYYYKTCCCHVNVKTFIPSNLGSNIILLGSPYKDLLSHMSYASVIVFAELLVFTNGQSLQKELQR